MNPVIKYNADNYKEILKEIENLKNIDYLKDFENRLIQEIVTLAEEGSLQARARLGKIEQMIEEELDFNPRSKLLFSALKNSIKGALSAAKFYLLL